MAMGHRIKAERARLGITQQQLADKCGRPVTQTTIQSIEERDSKSSQHASKIAAALGVTLDWLLTGEGDKSALTSELQTFEWAGNPDHLSIPQFDVSASMGHGAFPPEHIEVVRRLTVSLPDLRKQATFSAPKNLNFITAYGPSMEPTFSDGDILLIDRGVTEFNNIDGIYCFSYGAEYGLLIKSLQRIPGNGIRAISHNRAGFDPFDIDPSRGFEIHGRVVLAWNARRF